MEFAFQYKKWELLRHEKFPETHILATLVTGNALLFNGKKRYLAYQVSISELSGINKLFQNFQIFGGVRRTGFQNQKF